MAAGNSVIGAVRVLLGLDSAQFESGLKRSQTRVNDFSKIASFAFKAVGIAAAAAGAVMGAAAVRGAIDHADALSKSAQKAGITTEALSRLAYAASFSDVSMEDLTGSLGKLSKAMADATVNKTSQSALAFKSLGIQVTDANGKLRSSDAVFGDIADAFGRMEDGATKTALAMAIFGRSGAGLIPLLNGGREELRRLADEADRLGITLSTKTGRSAERFNDTLALVGQVLQGVTNKVMEAALPALQGLAQLLASPEFASAAQTLATNVIGALGAIVDAITGVINMLSDLGTKITEALDYAFEEPAKRTRARLKKDIADYEKMLSGGEWLADRAGTERKLAESRAALALLNQSITTPSGGEGRGPGRRPKTPTATDDDSTFDPIILGAAAAKKAIEITIPPLNEMQEAIRDVGYAFDDAVSSALSGLISDVIRGENAFDGLISKVGQLGDQLIQMALDSAIQGLFGNLIGGLVGGGGPGLGAGAIGRGVYGGVGGFFPAFPNFAGGGFTGIGSRAGGLDGQGGFMAMLHPNETVVDHTRGGGAAPGINITINAPNSTRDAAPSIAEQVRKVLPDAIADYNRNPWRRPT